MELSISVITISFNNLTELKETCSSIDEQQCPPWEHWIIDGSTNSEIRDWLVGTQHPPYRKWISEPDKGISDAFNKGIIRATGTIVNMLNSGDRFRDATVLETVARAFTDNNGITWLHGKCLTTRGGKQVVLGKPFDKEKLYRGMRSVWHQTMFVKRSLHDKYGLYDTSIRIAMDYDFVCRIANEPFLFLEKELVIFAPHGVSQSSYLDALSQMKQVYQKYFGNSTLLEIWQLRLKMLYYLLKSPAGKFLYNIKTKLKLENI